MGESHSLFRIVLFLGFVLLMGSVLSQPWVYVGQPLPSNSAWGQFSNGVQNFPTFDNPFDHGVSFEMGSANPNSGYSSTSWLVAHGTDQSCAQATFWNCIIDPNGPDGNKTYVDLVQGLVLNTTGWPSSGKVRYGTLTLTCHSNVADAQQIAVLLNSWIPSTGGIGTGYLQSSGERAYCHSGSQFATTTIHLEPLFNTVVDLTANPHPTNLMLEILNAHSAISSVILTVFVSDPNSCNGNDFFTGIGCTFSRFFQWAINAGDYVVSAFVFAGAVLFWFVGMIGIVFGGLLAVLSIPGAPPLITGMVGIIVIGCMFFVAIVIMGKIRGTGNVG